MRDLDVLLAELKACMGKEDLESRKKFEENLKYLQENDSPEVQKRLKDFMEQGLSDMRNDIDTLRKQIEGEYDILPLSYIAKNYFNKSRAWLYQRLNGYKVGGKARTLTDEEKEIFNNAVKDLAQRIGAIHLA